MVLDENISSSLAEMSMPPQPPHQEKDQSPGDARAMLGNSLSSNFFKKIKTSSSKTKQDEEVGMTIYFMYIVMF